MNPQLDPRRTLAHPMWWLALGLLAANDHLFKGAGVLPGAVTGKLSDVVGLLVAPALLAIVLGTRSRRGWIASHVAVGLGFAAINISPAIARMVEAATLPTPFPWFITVDPTDLMALPMLAVSAVVFGRFIAYPVALRPAVLRLGVILGGVASIATSSTEPTVVEPEPPVDPWMEEGWFAETNASLLLVNRTDEAQIVRTRSLRDGVVVDCSALDDPTVQVARDLFDAPVLWSLDPGLILGLSGDDTGDQQRQCDLILVDTAGGERLVFVDHRMWPVTRLRVDEGDTTVRPAHIALEPHEAGAQLSEHPALFAAPTRFDAEPVPECAQPAPGAGLDWTQPPVTSGFVDDVALGPDGCLAVDMSSGAQAGRWYVCAPGVEMPLAAGDAFEIELQGSNEQALLRMLTDRAEIVLRRGATPEVWPSAAVNLAAAPSIRPDCTGHRDACDAFVRPLAVLAGAEDRLGAGDTVAIDEWTVTVMRAEEALVTDGHCDTWADVGPRFELVLTRPLPENAR